MYKITKEMLEEFQRVMAIRPQLYHDWLFSKYPHFLANEDAEYYKDDANNDAANCLFLSKTAEMIYLAQQKQAALYWNYPHQDECEAVAIYKGRGKQKTLDCELAIELNDGDFLSYYGIYNEENAPKIEAQVVLYSKGTDAGAHMVKNGMAMVYDRYVNGHQYLYAHQNAAKNGKRGMWAGIPIKPWEWRRNK